MSFFLRPFFVRGQIGCLSELHKLMQGSGPCGSGRDDAVHERCYVLKRRSIAAAATKRPGTGEGRPADAQKPLQIFRLGTNRSNDVTLTKGLPRIR